MQEDEVSNVGGKSIPNLGMDSLLCWNVRGLNERNIKKKIKLFCNKQDAELKGLLETKIKVNKIDQVASSMFGG